ncbi:MAG: site-2 protease family protein [Cytophagales bacterium]|nr:site-2 protease family protein [Armatimonadota bacterium]
MPSFDASYFLMTLLVLLLSISFHEWAHAVTADAMGDPLPRSQGRVTLWPLAHLEPVGTILMVFTSITGVGLGWGKPVQSDPAAYTRFSRRVAGFLVVAAGPLSNILIATVLAQIIRWEVVQDDFYATWLHIAVQVNIGLCLFNLLPIAPLDGSKLLAYSLPPAMGEAFLQHATRVGPILLFILVMAPALGLPSLLGLIIGPAKSAVYYYMTGAY